MLLVWSALALPTLLLVKPHLRVGAMVVVDNYEASREGYRELASYLEDPTNGFRSTTAPYQGGLHIAVYLGSA